MRARIREARWAIAAVLVLGLLLGLVGGTLTAADHEAEAATTVSDRIMIPPAAFIPSDTDFDYTNDGSYLHIDTVGPAWGCFTAEVHFPVHMPIKKVNINRVFLWAHDNRSDRLGYLRLARPVPSNATTTTLAYIETTEDPDFVTTYRGTASGAPVFLWNNAPYLEVCIQESLVFYGAAINYSYDI